LIFRGFAPGGKTMVNCPKCEAVIDVDVEELDEGEAVSCDECGADLTVTSLEPLELKADLEDEDEDEDDDDEDFDFDEDDEEDEEEEEEEEDF
jgi:alpha-aminoadipate carrier protein LysW